ncbi:MAG: polyphenol oxidase family protein [Acidimicrobiales bacterium]|nr:polyphenol oxidase family protein [Acidimicrobiales bacterium]
MILSRGSVAAIFADRSDGDFSIDSDPVELRVARRALVPHPWTWLRQVHGAEVVVVEGPGQHAGAEADAAVTASPGAVLAIQTADCVPVLFHGEDEHAEPIVGAAHAGWRGAAAGVLPATVDAMRSLGAIGEVRALVGPCIAAASYEFGAAELGPLVERFGPTVQGATGWGTPALDLRALVAASLAEAGVDTIEWHVRDTATSADLHSHRARTEQGRQASVVWIRPADDS